MQCPVHGIDASLATINQTEANRQALAEDKPLPYPKSLVQDKPSPQQGSSAWRKPWAIPRRVMEAASRPRLPASRDRIVRRARSIRAHDLSPDNPRNRCCVKPDPRYNPAGAIYTTTCANCGATI